MLMNRRRWIVLGISAAIATVMLFSVVDVNVTADDLHRTADPYYYGNVAMRWIGVGDRIDGRVNATISGYWIGELLAIGLLGLLALRIAEPESN